MRKEKPMSRYAVHVQYLLPVWNCVIVNASTEEAAKQIAAEGDVWDSAEEDYDSAHPTTVEGIRELEEEDFPDSRPDEGDFSYGGSAGGAHYLLQTDPSQP